MKRKSKSLNLGYYGTRRRQLTAVGFTSPCSCYRLAQFSFQKQDKMAFQCQRDCYMKEVRSF